MMLIILDKNPEKCVDKLPRSIKFKQLIELCQLVCSAGISNVYKPVKQGRRLQSWIIRNKGWVFQYMVYLKNWCFKNVEMKMETAYKIDKILYDLFISTKNNCNIKTAVFRYSKDYCCDTESNSEINIDECIELYHKYSEWKIKKGVWRR